MKLKATLINLFVFLVSITVMLFLAEMLFRKLIFSDIDSFKNLRDPGLYSDYLNEDNYWKLYYIFGGEAKPPEFPHPLLGWVGNFNRNSFIHADAWKVGNRRPVLLYGDSYAQCMPEVSCFEDILNSDSSFNSTHFLINYGVGGFGVDQISLLYENSSFYFRDPFVVFSLMVYDLDRTPMSFRTGQKPFYEIINDSLVLKGVPVNPNPNDFIKNNPPDISSYLYRRFLYSDANFLSNDINSNLKHWKEVTNYKIELNSAILLKSIQTLRERNQDFVFVVFHYLKPGDEEFKIENDDNWRDIFLKEFLAKNNVPYIWSKDVIKNDPEYNGTNYEKYMLLDNGHPTTYLNQLISREIKHRLDENEALRNADYKYISSKILRDSVWRNEVKAKASQFSISMDESLNREASYLVEELVAQHKITPGTGYFRNKILTDSSWYSLVKEKANNNKVTIDSQIESDAFFIYNLEINKSRELNNYSNYFDARIKHILDSLVQEPEFINATSAESIILNIDKNRLIERKALEIYSSEIHQNYDK